MIAYQARDEQSTLRELETVANDLRVLALRMVHLAGSGHIGGSLSAADMMAALYFAKLPRRSGPA